MFHIASENLCRARAHHDSTLPKQLAHHFTEGDTVLIKNHTAGSLILVMLVTIALSLLRAIRLN